MPKTNGDITKAKLLEVAEKLFSEKGFDAASISTLAKATGVNKATIYYHFKDKQDILISLFKAIMLDLENHLKKDLPESASIKEQIRAEIIYLRSKKKILAVLLMEAIKFESTDMTLFNCADTVIQSDHISDRKIDDRVSFRKQYIYLSEFFTGFLPLISFVVFEDKWIKFVGTSKKEALDQFLEAFEKNHLNNHN
jgi:AcrR family transcriptional regulator